MLFKRLLRKKAAVSNIISTLLITGIMITSIALTYIYIIPTIERSRTISTLSTSSLFLSKMDNAMQSMFYDGVGSARTFAVDAFSGDLDFRSYGLNVRGYINGAMFLPIPALEYGLTRLTVTSDVGIIAHNSIKYLKGSPYDDPAVNHNGLGTVDPAVITMQRFGSEIYHMELYYRLLLQVRDTGIGGTIDVLLTAIQFTNAESLRGLHSGTYYLTVNKTQQELNPARYGFSGTGAPIITSGSNFYISVNKGAGLLPIFTSSGVRTSVTFNLLIITYDFNAIRLD